MTPEGLILDVCLDYLAAKHIFAIRMNVGQMRQANRFINFGIKGMADVLAFPITEFGPYPLWLEMKAAKGRQSPEQKSFEAKVRHEMHGYAVIRSVDELAALLQSLEAHR